MRRWSVWQWLRVQVLSGKGATRRRRRKRDLKGYWAAEVQVLESRVLLSAVGASQVAVTSLEAFQGGGQGATPQSTSGPTGYSPAQIKAAYGFNNISFNGTPGDGRNTTIAIVDAYNDPNIAGDLHQFDAQFGLPDPVLTVVNQSGSTSNLPIANSGWITEIALDVEWAHAVAPGANILLVEANSSSFSNLFAAVNTAKSYAGVDVVSMSWGGGEFSSETSFDSTFATPNGHPGVTFIASSGDTGAPASYPASSPNVLTIGGTTLNLNADNTWQSETGWSGSGGGVSAYESQPSYQTGRVTGSTTARVIPDVAYDANPNTGFPVYDSYNNGTTNPWGQWGGTSDAAPQWAALVAIADQGRAANGLGPLDGPTQTLPMLYAMSQSDFHDIVSGTSTGTPNLTAGPGYDLVTGRGSPIANLVVNDLVGVTNPVNLTPPQNVTASATSSTTAQLTWSAVTGAQGYRVFQVNGPQATLLATLGASAVSYQATGLTPASTASFMIEAYSGSVTADSTTVSVTLPLATPQLTVSALSSTSAGLSWGAVPQATGYRVYQLNAAGTVAVQDPSFESPALANAGGYTTSAPAGWTMKGSGGVFRPMLGSEVASVPDGSQVSWLNSGGSLFQDLGVLVDPNKTYELDLSVGTQLDNSSSSDGYRVDLVAGGASGTIIGEASGTLLAKSGFVPITVSGQGLGSGNLGVLITATSGQPLFDNIQVKVIGSQPMLLATLGANATSYQVNGLTPASTASFMVEAYNGSIIADSATASVTLPLATPQLTATALSPTSASLSWGAVSQASGYRVFQINGSQSTLLGTLGASATSFQVNGLTPASTASFVVEAFNGSVTADSATVNVTLPLATPQVTGSALSPTSASLTWGAIPQALGYRVFQINGSQSTLLATVGANTTSYQATGLAAGSTVSFMVEAYNGSVTADSATVSVTLPAPQLAGSIPVQDASFESPALAAAGNYTTSAPTGWTMKGSGGVFRPIYGPEVASVPDGSQVAWLNSGASLFQDLGVLVDPSKTYQLSLYVGTQLDNPSSSNGYRVDLVAGGASGTVIAEASGTLPAKSGFVSVLISGQGIGSGDLGILITATSGQPLFDNVQVQVS